jgi:hypothetical protein
MIVREHYADSYPAGAGGDLFRLDYAASAIPEAATVAQFLASAGLLFTVTTPRDLVCPGLRKETIELEGGAEQITAKIRYVQRAEDQELAGGALAILPAGAAGGDLPVVAPGAIALPLLSHHWRLRVSGAFLAPAYDLRCTGTCLDDPSVKALLQDSLGGVPLAVPTPQFGILGGMVKTEVAFEPHDGPAGMLRVTISWRSATAGPEEFPLVEIRCTTGLTPGSCTLTKSLRCAAPSLSETLGQTLAFEGRFTGRVVNVDRYVGSSGLYTASLTALDARWEMAGTVIGSAPIGVGADAAASYALRGYEWVFNRHGAPDRSASGTQFDAGDDAVYWTFGDILTALSDAYLPSTVTAPAWAGLANAGKTPGEIDLRGRDLASAIDTLLAQIGYTWTLRYSGSGAVLFPFNAADGTLSVPTGSIAAQSRAATYAKRADTIRDAYGQTEVLSGPALCQCGFASQAGSFAGFAPLVQATLEDAEFAYSFRPDFSNINSLFSLVPNRPGAGYPLHADLGSRLLDGAPGYAPARNSGDAAPASPSLPATSYFWVSWDDLGGAWRRVAGGIELRLFPGEVVVRRRITVYQENASQDTPKTEEVRPLDRAGFKIAGTLAFVTDARSSALSGTGTGLPVPRLRVVTQRDLVPVYAQAWIGDAFDADDLNGYAAFGPSTLVSADAQLADLAAAAQAGQATARVESEARLDYWPDAGAIGQELSLDGADFGGASGIVTELVLRRAASESCVVRASNQPLSSAQGRMEPVAAARRHFLSQLS